MARTTLCEVFRSPRKEGMYLYVDRAEGLERVPDSLLQVFGKPESALVLKLTEDRRLAQADAAAVLDALAVEGYYLQMPPGPGAGDSPSQVAAKQSEDDLINDSPTN